MEVSPRGEGGGRKGWENVTERFVFLPRGRDRGRGGGGGELLPVVVMDRFRYIVPYSFLEARFCLFLWGRTAGVQEVFGGSGHQLERGSHDQQAPRSRAGPREAEVLRREARGKQPGECTQDYRSFFCFVCLFAAAAAALRCTRE